MKLGVLRPTLAHVPAEPHGAKIDFDFRYMGRDMPTLLSAQERSGPATMWQDDGTLGWGPENRVFQSNDFDTTWARTRATVHEVTTDAPVGLNKCWRLNDNESTGINQAYISQTPVTVLSSVPYVYSLYAKADQLAWVILYEGGFDAAANKATYFDLANGVVGTQAHDDAGIEGPDANGWYRCWVKFTTVTDLEGSCYVYLADGDGDSNVPLNGTSSILIAGAQLNPGPLQPYLPTTTAYRYLLRNELSPFTGRRGLLMEGQRANIIPYSQDFSGWAGTAATKTSIVETDPGNGSTACLLTSNGASSSHYLISPTVSVVDTSTYTVSFYAKAGTASLIQVFLSQSGTTFAAGNYCNFSLTGSGTVGAASGLTGYIEACPGGWYRLMVTATCGQTAATYGCGLAFITATSDTRAPTNSSAGTVYVAFGQMEVGEMASSYIPNAPTAGATASRTADACTYTLPAALATALSGATGQGTMLVEFDYAGAGSAAFANNRVATLVGTSAANGAFIYNGSGKAASFYAVNGGTSASISPGSAANVNVAITAAASFKVADTALSVDGTAVSTDNTFDTMFTGTTLGIGWAASQLYGHIYRIRIWDHRLTDAELQAVTA